jgi:archaellum component FlaG (FlaF/FlaG flagellin family)
MGFSVTLSHVIMVIGSVILASTFSAYSFYTGGVVQNSMMQNARDVAGETSLQLEVVYATVDNSTSPSHFVIYVKNIGWTPVYDYTYLDIYVGEYGKAMLYSYDENAAVGGGQFNVTDANGDGVWECRETAVIKVFPESAVSGVMYEAKVVPFRGISSSYMFPASP